MLEDLEGKGLIIHHWDTDGICAARLLLEHLQDYELSTATPHLGNYYLTTEELTAYSAYDFIIIVDMALPEENVTALAAKAKIFIFDHHLQKEIPVVFHYNPIIKGASPEDYPSASWIVNEFLGNAVNLFALLGVIGDHEQRIAQNETFKEIITDFCEKHALTFEDLLTMVHLIDSNYKVADTEAVKAAPHFLLSVQSHHEILDHEKWKQNVVNLHIELSRQLATPPEEQQGILLKRMKTPYNIISTVTRRLAWDTKQDVLVVNTGYFQDNDQLYVRSSQDLEPIIQQLKAAGLRAGGKKEVLGAIVPKAQTEAYVEEILAFLTKRR